MFNTENIWSQRVFLRYIYWLRYLLISLLNRNSIISSFINEEINKYLNQKQDDKNKDKNNDRKNIIKIFY